jgi:hypothetical protein
MQRTTSQNPELRRNWRKRWLKKLYEFSSPDLQLQAWITGSGWWRSSFVECRCGYFDDLALGHGYGDAVEEGLVSLAEVALVLEFHAKADSYQPPAGDEHDHRAILDDPAWQVVVAAAQAAWTALTSTISDPGEAALVASLESRSWRAPGSRRG